ncbi:MAG: hypothetical protein DCF16_03585 [Alphaproteobacteria bacterium]|nr:MAG: hypothetical protein DCF16_03585 [Alphaproteobacteria bacterium]
MFEEGFVTARLQFCDVAPAPRRAAQQIGGVSAKERGACGIRSPAMRVTKLTLQSRIVLTAQGN